MPKFKGRYIVFEGIDGSGKTTQTYKLAKVFDKIGETHPNFWYLLTREPGGTVVGHKIREILNDYHKDLSRASKLFLFMADRSENMTKHVIPMLHKGAHVISDRSFYSSMAYQFEPRLDRKLDFCSIIPDMMTLISPFLMKPDIVFYLDVNPEDSANRISIDDDEISYLKDVRQEYLKISSLEEHNWHVIDGLRRPSDIKDEILDVLNQQFPEENFKI